jgi:cell division protein FtsB
VESFVITWRELLIGAVLILAVYIAEMLLLMRSAKNQGVKFRGGRADATPHDREFRALEAEVARLHEQVARLQTDLEKLKTLQQSTATPYTQAIQLAQQGVDVNEVAARCGISRGEAELIVALHRNTSP